MIEDLEKDIARTKAAFMMIQNKAGLKSSKDYIAVGAVMRFFEDLEKFAPVAHDQNLKVLRSQIIEMEELNVVEVSKLKASIGELTRKLNKAATLLRDLRGKNVELQKKLDGKIEKEFESALDSPDVIETEKDVVEDEWEVEFGDVL
jgi:hypothetical protein